MNHPNQIETSPKGIQLQHLRSKSPQFDPMNVKYSSNSKNSSYSVSWNQNENEELQGNKEMEIKTELVVSFRTLAKVEETDPKTFQSEITNKSKTKTQTNESANDQPENAFNVKRTSPNNGSINMKIPIKNDPGKPILEPMSRKKDTAQKSTLSNVSQSDVPTKLRSPSTNLNPRTSNSLIENPLTIKKPPTDSNPLLEPPSIKQAVSSESDVKPPQPNTSSTASQQTKQLVSQPIGLQKRSNSEKQRDRKGNRNQVLLSDPNTLIKMLLGQSKWLPELESPRVITKNYRVIQSFAVTTHRGIVRNYNEDRVSVLLNVQQNQLKEGVTEEGEFYSLFSLFDGHGGYGCCNYLKDHLHNKLLDCWDFTTSHGHLLSAAFKQLDYEYIRNAIDGNHKFSGSCSISLILGSKKGMAINLGDSRAICSRKSGTVVEDITADHKPEAIGEFTRVVKNKGQLYRMSVNQRTGEERYYFVKTLAELEEVNNIELTQPHIAFGPWRVKPGGLSVSRTFGDVESKMQSLGGLNGTVVCDPELIPFDYKDLDFLLLGCDGVFDKLTSAQVMETVWETIRFYKVLFDADNANYENILAECVNNVVDQAWWYEQKKAHICYDV